ncbi:uncharacterized protein LOC117342621 [Pecten maximus]|uniref:uncharacterized protein LOC117342621 n=1 Tax=Pecten maximus TaxID=6579 RepID=UPI001458E8B1|nr:uncharacterized protein LOC117342621 [Pecten maximus]
MENKCGYCNKKTLSLRRCSACQDVYYCSTVCQREDWRGQHKVKCKEIQKWNETESAKQTPDDIPFAPTNENGTGTVLYPSEPAHGIPHEQFMDFMRQDKDTFHFLHDRVTGRFHTFKADTREHRNEDDKDGTRYKTCSVCGKTNASVKTCGRCKKVDYCSKECQKKDRKSHKLQCKETKEEVFDTITTDGYRREANAFASAKSTSTHDDASHFFHPMPGAPDLSRRSFATPGALHKAKSLAWKAFPGCTILDFVREIPPELFGMRPRGTSRVAVGFISRFHQYMMRHCIFLQDKDGDEVYVGFYLERDDPRPYFWWE